MFLSQVTLMLPFREDTAAGCNLIRSVFHGYLNLVSSFTIVFSTSFNSSFLVFHYPLVSWYPVLQCVVGLLNLSQVLTVHPALSFLHFPTHLRRTDSHAMLHSLPWQDNISGKCCSQTRNVKTKVRGLVSYQQGFILISPEWHVFAFSQDHSTCIKTLLLVEGSLHMSLTILHRPCFIPF